MSEQMGMLCHPLLVSVRVPDLSTLYSAYHPPAERCQPRPCSILSNRNRCACSMQLSLREEPISRLTNCRTLPECPQLMDASSIDLWRLGLGKHVFKSDLGFLHLVRDHVTRPFFKAVNMNRLSVSNLRPLQSIRVWTSLARLRVHRTLGSSHGPAGVHANIR